MLDTFILAQLLSCIVHDWLQELRQQQYINNNRGDFDCDCDCDSASLSHTVNVVALSLSAGWLRALSLSLSPTLSLLGRALPFALWSRGTGCWESAACSLSLCAARPGPDDARTLCQASFPKQLWTWTVTVRAEQSREEQMNERFVSADPIGIAKRGSRLTN